MMNGSKEISKMFGPILKDQIERKCEFKFKERIKEGFINPKNLNLINYVS